MSANSLYSNPQANKDTLVPFIRAWGFHFSCFNDLQPNSYSLDIFIFDLFAQMHRCRSHSQNVRWLSLPIQVLIMVGAVIIWYELNSVINREMTELLFYWYYLSVMFLQKSKCILMRYTGNATQFVRLVTGTYMRFTWVSLLVPSNAEEHKWRHRFWPF